MDFPDLPHRLTLDCRKKLTVTGVTEVESFDDTAVLLKTEAGSLTVQGEGLKMLSLDSGQVAVEGQVSALLYEEPKKSGGWGRRLFG